MKNAASKTDSQGTERQSSELSLVSICVWQGYASTVGLDQFRKHERYSVWLHTHRRLILNDSKYASDTRWFAICIVCSLVLATGLWSYLSDGILAATFALACVTVLCCREQRRRNKFISDSLREPAKVG